MEDFKKEYTASIRQLKTMFGSEPHENNGNVLKWNATTKGGVNFTVECTNLEDETVETEVVVRSTDRYRMVEVCETMFEPELARVKKLLDKRFMVDLVKEYSDIEKRCMWRLEELVPHNGDVVITDEAIETFTLDVKTENRKKEVVFRGLMREKGQVKILCSDGIHDTYEVSTRYKFIVISDYVMYLQTMGLLKMGRQE